MMWYNHSLPKDMVWCESINCDSGVPIEDIIIMMDGWSKYNICIYSSRT